MRHFICFTLSEVPQEFILILFSRIIIPILKHFISLSCSYILLFQIKSAGKAVSFIEICVAHASILTILAISFERFYAICRPLQAGYKCTKRRAFVIILLIWIIALSSTLPMIWITELQVT